MSLNIKNARVHELAREAARVTGKTMTGAIEEALERLLADRGVHPQGSVRADLLHEARSIVLEFSADPAPSQGEIRRIDDLYDERGLPQ